MTLATSFISEWDEMYIGEVSSKSAKSALWKGHRHDHCWGWTRPVLFVLFKRSSLMETYGTMTGKPWEAMMRRTCSRWLHSWTFLCRCQWPFFFAKPASMRSGWIQCRQTFQFKTVNTFKTILALKCSNFSDESRVYSSLKEGCFKEPSSTGMNFDHKNSKQPRAVMMSCSWSW